MLFIEEEVEVEVKGRQKLAPFAVSHCCCLVRTRIAYAKATLPHRALRSNCAPLTIAGREIANLKGLLESTTPGHLCATYRPGSLKPTCEQLARLPIHEHSRDVASPTE